MELYLVRFNGYIIGFAVIGGYTVSITDVVNSILFTIGFKDVDEYAKSLPGFGGYECEAGGVNEPQQYYLVRGHSQYHKFVFNFERVDMVDMGRWEITLHLVEREIDTNNGMFFTMPTVMACRDDIIAPLYRIPNDWLWFCKDWKEDQQSEWSL